MNEIHTHLFVGGPYDGQVHTIEGWRDRGSVEVLDPANLPPPPDHLPPDNEPIEITQARTLYERTAYEGEETRFIFWKAEGLTIDGAMQKLFAYYSEHR